MCFQYIDISLPPDICTLTIANIVQNNKSENQGIGNSKKILIFVNQILVSPLFAGVYAFRKLY